MGLSLLLLLCTGHMTGRLLNTTYINQFNSSLSQTAKEIIKMKFFIFAGFSLLGFHLLLFSFNEPYWSYWASIPSIEAKEKENNAIMIRAGWITQIYYTEFTRRVYVCVVVRCELMAKPNNIR